MDKHGPADALLKRIGIAAAIAVPAAAALRSTPASAPGSVLAQEPEWQRVAHLLRRAGFGAGRAELDAAAAAGFDATLEELLQPSDERDAADIITDRIVVPNRRLDEAQRWWLVRMRYTSRPLVEKMALFWHGHFTTAISKVSNGNLQLMRALTNVFRTQGMGNFHDLLLAVSRDSTMSIWLDGWFNHKDAPNENYARELMELFTLGIGNYTEDDVKAAARAFTGWTFGSHHEFVFNAADHDTGPKTFLGQTDNFNGDDIIDILAAQPATATHLATKLAQFFVADPPDPLLVQAMADTYFSSGYDIRSVLRTMFRSDAFSDASARHALIKSPAEFVAGTLRMLGIQTDGTGLPAIMAGLGQELFNPPNVAGWPGGPSWITTNAMLVRANMANTIAAGQEGTGWYVDVRSAFGLPERPSAGQVVDAVTSHLVDAGVTSEQTARLYRYLGMKPDDRIDFARDDLKLRGLLYLTLTLPVYQLN